MLTASSRDRFIVVHDDHANGTGAATAAAAAVCSPRCPRCDARPNGGPFTQTLPHHPTCAPGTDPHPPWPRNEPPERIADLRRCLPQSHRRRPHRRLTQMARPRHRRHRAAAAVHNRDRDGGSDGPDASRPCHGDAIAHWDRIRQLARAQPPAHHIPADPRVRRAAAGPYQHAKLQRQERSALWFGLNRDGGNVILHHRHIRPVLIRDWQDRSSG
jgi:hypothetical protein